MVINKCDIIFVILFDNYIMSAKSSEYSVNNPNDKKCAPSKKFENGSCLSVESLVSMADAYNIDNQHDKIKVQRGYEVINPDRYKKYLLKQFRKKISSCDSQQCWLEQNFMKYVDEQNKKELESNTFLPEGPTGRFEWLNTLNINDVMSQYENHYPNFKFFGAVPIDFDKLSSLGIRDANYKNLVQSGKTQFGYIFNLDEHWQSGSHWVAMYADVKKGEFIYFDSYGTLPEQRIRDLMKRLALFSRNELGLKKLIIDYNKNRHQYKNSECGVYSINFILRMLKGESFVDIEKSKIPDDEINQCRKKYFRNVDF